MNNMFGGPPNNGVYGSAGVPAEQAWNPSKGGGSPLSAGAMGVNSIVPYVVLVAVLWILAERHAKARVGGSASAKL